MLPALYNSRILDSINTSTGQQQVILSAVREQMRFEADEGKAMIQDYFEQACYLEFCFGFVVHFCSFLVWISEGYQISCSKPNYYPVLYTIFICFQI